MTEDQIACLTHIQANTPSHADLIAYLPALAEQNSTVYLLLKMTYITYDRGTDEWSITAAGITALGG